MVDSPSFPLASKAYPELAREGSWTRSNASIYSEEQVAAVMLRAKQVQNQPIPDVHDHAVLVTLSASCCSCACVEKRFVDVVLEIDTPAHTLAIAKAHPEMVTPCWGWMATARFKTDVDSDDCMALDPTNSAARKMVKTLLAEAAGLEGSSPYVHVGGDEGAADAAAAAVVLLQMVLLLPLLLLTPPAPAVKFPCWNNSSKIKAHVAATYGDTSDESFAKLQAEWTANVSCAAVVAAGKRPVLWQPTTKGPGDPAWDGKLPASSIYMIWLNSASETAYAKNGSDVVSVCRCLLAACLLPACCLLARCLLAACSC